jgi:hypothetical protein
MRYEQDDPGRLGRNWTGYPKELNMRQPSVNSLQYRPDAPEAPEAPYKSAIERQMDSMEGQINFLNNAIDTLEQRLRLIVREVPCKAVEASLPCADSPLGKGLENFSSRLNVINERILHLIERLEV